MVHQHVMSSCSVAFVTFWCVYVLIHCCAPRDWRFEHTYKRLSCQGSQAGGRSFETHLAPQRTHAEYLFIFVCLFCPWFSCSSRKENNSGLELKCVECVYDVRGNPGMIWSSSRCTCPHFTLRTVTHTHTYPLLGTSVQLKQINPVSSEQRARPHGRRGWKGNHGWGSRLWGGRWRSEAP